jgi:hypothetical protein
MSDFRSENFIIDRLDHTFCTYPTAFRSALEVIGASPVPAEYAEAVLRKPADAEASYDEILKELAYPSLTYELPIVLRALHSAMANFVLRDCRVPTREEILVGLFRGAISEAFNLQYAWHVERGKTSPIPRLFTVDLNIAGREARTGGDIAFIFDVMMADGERLFVPICLQAKRAAPEDGEPVDIARTNGADKVGEHQLTQLEEFADVGCNCAYLFFNNDLKRVINEPIVPLIKTVTDIREEKDPMKVDLGSNSIDFASYVLHLFSRRINAVGSAQGLEKVVAKLAESKVSHLVLISPRAETWQQIMAFTKGARRYYVDPRPSTRVDFAKAMSEDNSYAPKKKGQVLDYTLTR